MTNGNGSRRLEGLALSERGFLFDPTTGQTYSLSTTATFALKQLIAGASRERLAGLLTERFEVDEETARRDMEQFLLCLEELELLERRADDGPDAPRGGDGT